ncbi:hypothetical protein [Candidatus Nardonella dryophthoridicola]|uniref:Uncharacterized protein n=1 Tax=endosymbiont of Metamasius hemipterus TaxID=204627 RepID=A0ABT0TW60_9GAMM|nr:hypothetical protein [Candidatus Nardonella dryophthoridicola]MCM0158227.1 hypothetical protein [endosymbiont of Metamasius hemipterus]
MILLKIIIKDNNYLFEDLNYNTEFEKINGSYLINKEGRRKLKINNIKENLYNKIIKFKS